MYINLYKTAKEEAHFCSDSQERWELDALEQILKERQILNTGERN